MGGQDVANEEYIEKSLLLKSTKEKEAQKAELTSKIKELEKQAGKLRMKGTLYSIFGNSELDKAEKCIEDLEQEAEQ